MQVTFLGTGTSQGIPVIGCKCEVCSSADPRDKRMRTALMLENGTDRLIVDTGPDFRQQMLSHKVTGITGVLITHEHNDHIAGLDDLRSFNFVSKKPVDIWAEQRVIGVLKRQFPYVFADEKYPGTPQLVLHEMNEESFDIGSFHVEPIRVYHYKLPVLGFRFGNVAYLTDVSEIPATAMKKLQGLKLLIIDALRIKPHISHFNLEEALRVVKQLKPEQARFIHISHQLGSHTSVNAQLPDHIGPAWDGLVLNV